MKRRMELGSTRTGQPPPHAVLRQSRYRKDDGGQTHRTAVSPDGAAFSGHTIETCRTKLVGEYIGETENTSGKPLRKPGEAYFLHRRSLHPDYHETRNERFRERGDSRPNSFVLSEPNPDMIIILMAMRTRCSRCSVPTPACRNVSLSSSTLTITMRTS